MKTEFEARPAFVRLKKRIMAHFLICFLALLVYRLLEGKLGGAYTCEELLNTLKEMNLVDVEGQGYMPLYKSQMHCTRSVAFGQTTNLLQNKK